MKCDGSGMMDGKPCPSCKKGKKAAKAEKRRVRKALAPEAVKKKKTMCSACGAKQSMKHDCCTECGKPMPRPMPAVAKNHDFACLGCGHDPLDKGEKHCPSCGRENPGYNLMADHKIPMNADKAAKERVTKRKKAKAGKKGNPFGDKQAPPFGAKDGDEDEPKGKKPPKAKKSAKPAAAKRKGKGKGRSPAAGVAGHDGDTMGLPAHREPDGAPVEEFEDDAKMQDGDERQEMAAAMRHKSLAAKGLSRDDALLHDLTCPAFSPQSVARAFPYATFAGIDDGLWRQKMLDDAATAPLEIAGRAVQMWQHATTLKGADADILSDLRIEHHEAFLSANKAFRDATPGPGSFPTPSHVTPGQFRRPYIDAGHAAPSPQHAAPHSFGVPEGQPSAEDYTRSHLTEGHAADSPQNDTPRHEPQPASMEPGKPDRIYYRGTMRDNARQAMVAMHDHISRVFPDVCPMSPELTGTQKPAPPVPAGVGGPAPRASRKARKAAAKKTAKAAARKRRRLEQQVLKGKITVKQARAKLGMKPKTRKPAAVVKAMAPAPAAPIVTPLDPEVIKAAIAEANAPLMERVAAQDKRLRKQAKALNAIASQPDTSMAPLRGVAMTKSSAAAVPQPDTVQGRAERAQDNLFRAFLDEWRNSPDPGAREAAWSELTKMTGIDMTKQT